MTKKQSSGVIYKHEFYRLLANESQFTIGDIKIIWRAVEKIFLNAMLADKELQLSGLGNFYVKHIPPYHKWDALHGGGYIEQGADRVIFRVSATLRKILKQRMREEKTFEEVENLEDLEKEE